jgi:CRP-like cAMP-binding protein
MSDAPHPDIGLREAAASDSRRALFADHPVLGSLTARELDQVLGFVVLERYAAGEVLFRKGDAGQRLMLIAAGRVKISVSGPEGKEAVLAVLGVGEILGEMAILENKPRSADATALEPCQVLVLHQRDFIPFLERNPAVAIRLLAMMCDRLRRTSELVEERMLRNLPGRLARALLDLGKCRNIRCPPGTRIELQVRQKTFASLLGTSRETLNKQLHAWQAAGLISLNRRSVVIERPDALAQLIDA